MPAKSLGAVMNLQEIAHIQIPHQQGTVRSLCWEGDELVDWARGGARFRLDGTSSHGQVNWAFRFDHALTTPSGKYQVIYETLGTKGLVLNEGNLVREIDRSFYYADIYEYPVALIDLPGNGTGLVHCPGEYNRLEIEEIESGKKLTIRESKSPDFFQSRLRVSPNGLYLLSAGWLWSPYDGIALYSMPRILESPEHLDLPIAISLPDEIGEIRSAAFQDNSELLLTTASQEDESITFLVRYVAESNESSLLCKLESTAGTIMPVGPDYVVGFYEHPKLFQVSTGKIVYSWPELDTGLQNSSILRWQKPPPPLALDAERMRFAVAGPEEITVIQLG